jgi:hypothetical protein
MKAKELTCELRQKSAERVGKSLEMRGLDLCLVRKSAEVRERAWVADFVQGKEFASYWKQRADICGVGGTVQKSERRWIGKRVQRLEASDLWRRA